MAAHQDRQPMPKLIDGENAAGRSSSWLKWSLLGVAAGTTALSVAAAGSSALAGYFARRVVTPEKEQPDDLAILAVLREGDEFHIVLPATKDTTVDGVYGLAFDAGSGQARIGAIRSYVPREGSVTRVVEEVLEGDLQHALRGRLTGAVYRDPSELGLAAEEVLINLSVGPAPAWIVPAEPSRALSTWAIMVHGRGARRTEGLRAVRTARELGLTSLLISYRNDGDAPETADGLYGLGFTEWRDVEAAIEFALSRGAKDIVLFGYSMGGAISLQLVDQSRYRSQVIALVLDSPVINWIDVLAHQAALNKVPAAIGRYGQLMLSHPLGRRITGLAAPVDLKSMDWVSRAVELRTPTLIMHSRDDDFVPYGPSKELARRNPEMVTFVEFSQAGHTREWNVDAARWEAVVTAWLVPRLGRYELPRDTVPEEYRD
ncbi:hydrolases of the alpha/beta superfamily [Renibacterium salmoninarum ATCC 33209]|uniref:Hydrolases of the alpha/beta superfamily n=1 Tax=Renibacterium salmoninarum (strain ATCC 33209 / DSM 20767 / JCM 11484 / NBRC 15589 / NCIMB 2235) TaxID=288705 RepID=A9WR92_RENSM|nr:hydrolases of the alpha/beta superfamily [Renibacterium salmoninarum ATCC 33209]